MDFLKNLPWSPMFALKASAALLSAVIVVSFLFNAVAPQLGMQRGYATESVAPVGYGGGYAGNADYSYTEQATYDASPQLSVRNVVGTPSSMPAPMPGATGSDAEEFEVTDYSVSIETRDKDDTCTGIAKLKEYTYVIFENANEHERGCSFGFKVEKAHAEEILGHIVTYFSPKEVSENTYTIKRQLQDFTSEMEILEKKLASIDDTLESALAAYNEITELASRTNDADALARVINSKIGILERLTQERLAIAAQLERLSRSKAEQLDRLEYTYFHVSVYEKKYVDGEDIRDSWKNAVSATLYEANKILQEATLGLLAFLLLVGQWILYLLILVVIAKYLWKFGVYLWNK